jgi:alkylation response protein AidB-like acyl-CoA dehydrogenase
MSDQMISIEDFRTQLRSWLAENMEAWPDPDMVPSGSEDPGDEQVTRSRVLQRKLFDARYAGIAYPAQYGGAGLTPAHERVFKEECRIYKMPDFGGAGRVMLTAIGRSMLDHASTDFLERHIPPLLSGSELWCQFYSEPEAGSDLAGIRTTARRDGDTWVITGSKIWSTGAHHADWAMCLARTDWDVPKHRGLTWFAVPTAAPGVTVRQITQIDGSAGFCEAFLDDVVVPDADRIGDLNQGWTVAQTMLVYERGAGESGAHAREPRVLAPDLVELARQVGRVDDPTARQLIARAHVNDNALYHLGRRLGQVILSAPTPQPALASYGKLGTGTMFPIRGRIAVEIGGPEAVVWSADDGEGEVVATRYLNSRQASIAAGTNEVQRNGIAERVLGLPREPTFDSSKPFSEVVKAARDWNPRIG